MYAMAYERPETVSLLLQSGANPKLVDCYGSNAIAHRNQEVSTTEGRRCVRLLKKTGTRSVRHRPTRYARKPLERNDYDEYLAVKTTLHTNRRLSSVGIVVFGLSLLLYFLPLVAGSFTIGIFVLGAARHYLYGRWYVCMANW